MNPDYRDCVGYYDVEQVADGADWLEMVVPVVALGSCVAVAAYDVDEETVGD